MKRRWMLLIGLAVCAAPIVNAAGSTYSVSSVQLFSQFNPSSPVPPSLGYNFLFSALAPTTATLNGFQVSQPLPANAVSHDFEFAQAFTTASARNAYYPNTTLGYTLSGPAFSTVSMTTANSLPISIPYVLGGTWQNRMLMIDADRGGLINLSPFPQYGTFSVGSRMRVTVTSLNSDNFSLIQPIATTSIPGYAVSSIPFDHCGIPAKALKPGLCYLCTVSYEAITSLDITTNPGTAAIGTNGEVMNFFIAAIPTASVPAPAITTQPTNQVVPQGGNATFSASMSYGGASQPANTAFIWYANGLPVDYGGSKYTLGADGTLTINNVGTADAGTYALVAVNAGGLAQTSNVSLAVTTSGLAAPTITVQPLNIIVNGGSTAALKVTATSANPISYQWRKDGVVIAGATSDTMIIPNVTASNSGSYTVLVSDSSGSVTSSPGKLTVALAATSRISNLSVRTNLAAGQTLTVGFVTSGSKSMLLRGIGPSLNPVFGLIGFYPDPKVSVINAQGSVIAQNDDWNSSLSATFASLGAFPLTPGSKDAALQLPIAGATTAQINGTGSGIVLVEVYDADAAGAPIRLVNVSARNQVGTGDNVLISGFVIAGAAARTVLIRGIGPALHDVFGVTGQLVDPVLEVHQTFNLADSVMASNDDWNASLAPVFSQVGAYQFSPRSKDAALVVTLPAGIYTAQLSGANLGTGDGVIEIYELP